MIIETVSQDANVQTANILGAIDLLLLEALNLKTEDLK